MSYDTTLATNIVFNFIDKNPEALKRTAGAIRAFAKNVATASNIKVKPIENLGDILTNISKGISTGKVSLRTLAPLLDSIGGGVDLTNKEFNKLSESIGRLPYDQMNRWFYELNDNMSDAQRNLRDTTDDIKGLTPQFNRIGLPEDILGSTSGLLAKRRENLEIVDSTYKIYSDEINAFRKRHFGSGARWTPVNWREALNLKGEEEALNDFNIIMGQFMKRRLPAMMGKAKRITTENYMGVNLADFREYVNYIAHGFSSLQPIAERLMVYFSTTKKIKDKMAFGGWDERRQPDAIKSTTGYGKKQPQYWIEEGDWVLTDQLKSMKDLNQFVEALDRLGIKGKEFRDNMEWYYQEKGVKFNFKKDLAFPESIINNPKRMAEAAKRMREAILPSLGALRDLHLNTLFLEDTVKEIIPPVKELADSLMDKGWNVAEKSVKKLDDGVKSLEKDIVSVNKEVDDFKSKFMYVAGKGKVPYKEDKDLPEDKEWSELRKEQERKLLREGKGGGGDDGDGGKGKPTRFGVSDEDREAIRDLRDDAMRLAREIPALTKGFMGLVDNIRLVKDSEIDLSQRLFLDKGTWKDLIRQLQLGNKTYKELTGEQNEWIESSVTAWAEKQRLAKGIAQTIKAYYNEAKWSSAATNFLVNENSVRERANEIMREQGNTLSKGEAYRKAETEAITHADSVLYSIGRRYSDIIIDQKNAALESKKFGNRVKEVNKQIQRWGYRLGWLAYRLTNMGKMMMSWMMKPLKIVLNLLLNWENTIMRVARTIGFLTLAEDEAGEAGVDLEGRLAGLETIFEDLITWGMKLEAAWGYIQLALLKMAIDVAPPVTRALLMIGDAMFDIWERTKPTLLPLLDDLVNIYLPPLLKILKEVGPAFIIGFVQGITEVLPHITNFLKILSPFAGSFGRLSGWLTMLAPGFIALGYAIFFLMPATQLLTGAFARIVQSNVAQTIGAIIGPVSILSAKFALTAAASIGLGLALSGVIGGVDYVDQAFRSLAGATESIQQLELRLYLMKAALVAAGIAVTAFGIALGIATGGVTFIFAGMAMAITGLSSIIQQAFTDQTIVAAEAHTAALEDISQRYESEIRTIENALNTELSLIRTKFTEELGITQNAVDSLNTTITNYFDSIETELKDSYDQRVMDIESAYSAEIALTNVHYDGLLTAAEQSVIDIRSVRSEAMDDLELMYLREKKALGEAGLSEEDYAEAVKTLTNQYYADRRASSDTFRLQELEAQEQFKIDSEKIEDDRVIALAATNETADAARQTALTLANQEYLTEVELLGDEEKKILARIAAEVKIATDKYNDDLLAAEVAHNKELQTEMDTANAAKLAAQTTFNSAYLNANNVFRNQLLVDWNSGFDAMQSRADTFYNDMVGDSLWPDLIKEMVGGTKEGMSQISDEFGGLDPSINAANTAIAGANVGVTGTLTPVGGGPITVYIDVSIGSVTGDVDVDTLTNEIDTKLETKLRALGLVLP